METEKSLPDFVMEEDRKSKKLSTQRCPFVGCFGRNHRTTKSKDCAYCQCRTKNELLDAIKQYLKKTYPDQYGEYKSSYYIFSKKSL